MSATPPPNGVECFVTDIQARITYWRKEANLSYAEAVGALEIIKLDLYAEMQGEDDDDPWRR